MNHYKHILVAVELEPHEDKQVIEKALAIAQNSGATISLVHAVEHLNTYGTATAYPAIAEVEEEILKDHRTKLEELARSLNIPTERQFLDFGAPAIVIGQTAEETKADLVVTGSHGRHGLALLFGSTTDSVLHRVQCDILAVHLPK
jgi:universal stress protein A